MKAMVLTKLTSLSEKRTPLSLADLPVPAPAEGEVLIKVSVCGVCHTELHEIEGRTPPPRLPVVPGHQIVARVAGLGRGAVRFRMGARVGIAWIQSACGKCVFCRTGQENLCDDFRATDKVRQEYLSRIHV